MRLAARIRTADPLAGQLPDELTPPRLPAEVRVAEPPARHSPRPHHLRRGTVAAIAAACLVAALMAVVLAGSRSRETASFETFNVSSVSGERAPAPLIEDSVTILRRRLAALDVRGWTVETSSRDSIRLSCAACEPQSDPATALSVAQTGRLLVYDWESNVLDSRCRPQPTAEDVTGGAAAGQPGAGSTTYYSAVLRAARCPARRYHLMSHSAPDYYALDRTRERVLSGPEPSGSAALTVARAKTPQGDLGHVQIVRVLAGTTVVTAAYAKGAPRNPNDAEWYVLRDRPALTGQNVTDPRLRFDNSTGAPVVAVRFTSEGQQRWRATTRRIAERGLAQARPGVTSPAAAQHFAIALDHRLLTVPYIDFRQHPHGLGARTGVQIGGGFTAASARTLVALLESGALPVRLSQATSH